MKHEETPWSEGVMLICTKCHKSISASLLKEEGNAAENLKIYLKKKMKDEGLSSKVRVITSGCLDICIDDTQAVSFAGRYGGTESFTLHPENEKEELLDWLRKKASP
jgi:predicted metal-binding protein